MSGRPTKLTEQMAARVLPNLRQSEQLTYSAAPEGVGKSTVFDWLQRGERKSSGPYHAFSRAVTAACEARLASLCSGHHKLAMGCVREMPAPDRSGRALYDAEGKQIFSDVVFRPQRSAIERELKRLDRRTLIGETHGPRQA